ncbi:2,3-diaminopropionate biosynthesis protein SbnA [Amycolatopsis magusensis]|uniref:N-(2-amino-2-carboxyethyl)-L-glutamate synthase n=1 Tax=Amycolatopsis magusensis TaxID=882444 RepID=A0ABS4PVZ6_9PSEU|nr:2,3-diaminopropionate biosynthesis protein SbnA [Amycolatopsis magusensis]MBP2183597.1 cysteine synthase A [Amycolatopsis magusensis]MDI5982061.1 2,3-diaminopropionate biosynthesis protein SbnA [Amycolatopsis magusensis]
MSPGSPGSAPPGILAAIGRTPLVELRNLLPGFGGRVFAKLERSNPGGSIKDRTAYAMLRGPLESGELVPGRSVVVESSSGNLAIGLAQVCRYFDLRFVCVVDARTTSRNLALLAAYQAEVEVITEPDRASGEYLPARLARVRELAATVPHAFWPNQYTNPLNPAAHHETMAEIAAELGGRVDFLFASASTFGTLRGCADHIRATGMATRVIGVDATGSVIFGREAGPRLLPGHGASVVPPLTDPSLIDEVVHVSDLDSVVACRRLLRREAVLAGGSSGAVVAALEELSPRIPDGAHCVLVFADGGDRYLDTIFSDAWVTANFGEVAHLWASRDLSGV